MKTVLLGEPGTFAIEYARPETGLQGFIHTRLWVGGRWFGKLQSVVVADYFVTKLCAFHSRHRYECPYVFRTLAESPSFEKLFESGVKFWLGEAFDGFENAYVRILDPASITFAWRLDESRYQQFPEYDRSLQRGDVYQDIFDGVIELLVTELRDLLSPLTLRFYVPMSGSEWS